MHKARRARKRARDRKLAFRRRDGKSGWVIKPARLDSITGIAYKERYSSLALLDFISGD